MLNYRLKLKKEFVPPTICFRGCTLVDKWVTVREKLDKETQAFLIVDNKSVTEKVICCSKSTAFLISQYPEVESMILLE